MSWIAKNALLQRLLSFRPALHNIGSLWYSSHSLPDCGTENLTIFEDHRANNAPSNDDNQLEVSYKETDALLHKIRKTSPLSTFIDMEYLNSIAPPIQKSFNLAAVADKSDLIQQFIKLGVNLTKIEKKGPDVSERIVKFNFENDVLPHLQFLSSHGVLAEHFGKFITKNPEILFQDLDDLQTRINYLKSKAFKPDAIARIITLCPTWLNLPVKAADSRLGNLQTQFNLTGPEVRYVLTKQPKLGATSILNMNTITFAVREEMGFSQEETKVLFLAKPKLWVSLKKEMLMECFDYVHNTIGLSHELILNFPGALGRRTFLIRQRHEYLVKVGCAQYDPKQPNFVSLKRLCSGTDEEFCFEVAKTSVEDYNEFLKTM